MRPLRALSALVFLLIGAALGALNPAPAMVDLGVGQVSAGLGVILLCTLLAGVLIGGMAISVSVVLPLRRQLRCVRETQIDGPAPQTSALIPTSPSLEP
jgi:lipopolysaccharide assembly protein A